MDISAMATGGGIAAVCLAVGFVLWKRRKAPKLVGWLALIAGFGISGGLLGTLLHQLGGMAAKAASITTDVMFGVAVPMAVLAGMGLWVALDLWPRTKPSKALPVLALAFPILLATAGGIFAGFDDEVISTVGVSVQTFMTRLVDGSA